MSIVYSDLFQTDLQYLKIKLENIGEPRSQEDLCYLAVVYGRLGEIESMQDTLEKISENDILSNDTISLYHEAKIIEAYNLRNYKLARDLAEKELIDNKSALLSVMVLAKLNMKEKYFPEAIQNYKDILAIYPNHNDTLMNIFGLIIMSNGSKVEAKKYLLIAKPSFRKSLYLFLFPSLGFDFWKLGIIILLLFVIDIPTIGNILLIGLLLFVISIQALSIYKSKVDLLVIYWTYISLGTIAILWVARAVLRFIFSL
jgi:tetratricopeptide (TPR) repeat protein